MVRPTMMIHPAFRGAMPVKGILAAGALALALVLSASVLTAGPADAPVDVDLELVLAVDASGSVDQREYALQTQGIAASFRDQTVLAALRSGATSRRGM
jgi:hypothetical protein